MGQMSLQLAAHPAKITRHYVDLTIDEKINIKANSAGFQSNWLKSMLPWYVRRIGVVNKYSDRADMLIDTWYWHHKVNDKHRFSKAGRLNMI